MSIKKVLIVGMTLLCLCGCSKEKKELSAADFLSAEEVAQFVDFEPVSEEENTRLCKSITYMNEKVGASDPVKVEVYPYNQKYDKSDIKAQFEAEKAKYEEYSAAETVEGLGAEAFVAIPSIHMYKNGYYLVITAGSGTGEHRKQLLESLGKVAAEHLTDIAGEEEEERDTEETPDNTEAERTEE